MKQYREICVSSHFTRTIKATLSDSISSFVYPSNDNNANKTDIT